ncbi:MAG: Lar family restriction alleviation protein [Oscillospiraceae bacterium]
MQDGEFKWTVECLECGMITSCFDSEQEAIEAWNRRADDEKL